MKTAKHFPLLVVLLASALLLCAGAVAYADDIGDTSTESNMTMAGK